MRRNQNGAEIVQFAEASQRLIAERELRFEAWTLTERHGPNPYSEFLTKHGRRPTRGQAATIGRLMGARVKASDGTLQPKKITSPKATERSGEDERIDQILRLRSALANLAANKDDPALVIRYMNSTFGDESVIRGQLDHAVRWINRFAQEFHREQETRGDPGRVHQVSE